MLDWTRISELRDEIGADDFSEVVDLFLNEVEERLKLLDVKKAPELVEDHLHFLKGSALNLGFSAFAELCQNGENRAAKGESLDDSKDIYDTYQLSKAAFLEKLNATNFA